MRHEEREDRKKHSVEKDQELKQNHTQKKGSTKIVFFLLYEKNKRRTNEGM